MTRFTSPRFFLAIGLVAALSIAVVAQQRSTTDGHDDGRDQLPRVAQSGAAAAGDLRLRFRRASALALRAAVRAQRSAGQSDDRTAAQARARVAEDRVERARLRHLHEDHAAREHSSRSRRAAARRAIPRAIASRCSVRRRAKGTWGWRVEFHHVSLHFDVVNGTAISSTPSFAGANPAEVKDGPQKGQRTLGHARGHRARAGDVARRGSAQDRDLRRRRAERHRHGQRARHQAALAARPQGVGDEPPRSAIR